MFLHVLAQSHHAPELRFSLTTTSRLRLEVAGAQPMVFDTPEDALLWLAMHPSLLSTEHYHGVCQALEAKLQNWEQPVVRMR